MPITPSPSNSDPFASLASITSSVILALEKLRQQKNLDGDDLDALKRISSKFDSLSQANRLRDDPHQATSFETAPADVRSGFFTLVAIESTAAYPSELPDFETMAAQLRHIFETSSTSQPTLPTEEIEAAQVECVEFLERLNQGRPEFPRL